MRRKIRRVAPSGAAAAHAGAPLSAWGSALAKGEALPGAPGACEALGHWGSGLRRRAHTAELKLRAAHLSLAPLLRLVKAAKEEAARLYTGSTVAMHVVNAMMLKSKPLMRQLRLLHALTRRGAARRGCRSSACRPGSTMRAACHGAVARSTVLAARP